MCTAATCEAHLSSALCLADNVSDSTGELGPGAFMRKALPCVALSTGLDGKKVLQDH